jgi:hypothetical protein
VSQVGEKARIITVPSYYHSTILSPRSHLTYKFLSTSPECKSGVKGANQGWEAILAMNANDNNVDWIFDRDEKPRCANSDLKSATDAVYFS